MEPIAKAKRRTKGIWAGRLILGFVGLLLALYGFLMPMLGFIGERTTGEVTVVRRELGDRRDPKANRYSWSVGFEFTLPDGRIIGGNTKTIGDAQSSGIAMGPHPVRYLADFPHLNALEKDTRLDAGNIIMFALGIGLCTIAIRLPWLS